ncbi:MAG TPA: DUF3137 domain-containing protein [Allosphingosinicella sp.]
MIALESRDFEELCRAPAVHGQLETMESSRSAALKTFWLLLIGAAVVGGGVGYALMLADYPTIAFIAGFLIFFFGIVLAYTPLAKVGEGLKTPVLEALAAKAGMEYLPSEFAPPLYPEAKKALFGSWISSEAFSDLFNGRDEEGRGVAAYEAVLQRGSGRSRHIVFSGQIYALQRESNSGATTVIVPDRGLLNFFKPSGGLERVRIEDEDFERRFEVYSTHEVEAKQLLFSSTLRRLLLDLRQKQGKGKVFAWFGSEGVLVATSGKDRFEPGSMFRSRDSQERTRSMFDDFCGSLGVLGRLRDSLR